MLTDSNYDVPAKENSQTLFEIWETQEEAEEQRWNLTLQVDNYYKRLVGGAPTHEKIASFASVLPFNDPLPEVDLSGRFCFTGEFAFGSRKDCMSQAAALGGMASKTVTMSIDYLVVGLMGSQAWAHSAWGRKIETAVRYRDEKGKPIAIIGEDHWASFLF